MMGFDTVIKGGTIIDGLRTPRFVSDIGIRDGRVAYIGDIADPGGAAIIDAKGLIVAPGIIDLHTHYDSQIFWDPYCTISGWHGVTSVVIGNCGFGFAPCKPEERDRSMLTMSRNEAVPLPTMKAGMPWDWETYPEFLDSVERTPKGVNVMAYVPLSPLLSYVMGLEAAKSRPATAKERTELRRLFNESLDAGGCGFSIQRMQKNNVQKDYDGTPMITDVMAHEDILLFAEVMRERGEGFIQTLSDPELADELAGVSGRPVVWNTLVAVCDQHGAALRSQEEVLTWLAEVNSRGGHRIIAQSVTCGIAMSFTMEDWNLFDVSPLWLEATLGDRNDRLRKLADPERRRALREEHDAGKGPLVGGVAPERSAKPGDGGIETVFIIGPQSDKYKPFEGNTIRELAAKLGKHPVDAFLDLVVEEDLKTEFQTAEVKPNTEAMDRVVTAPYAIPGLSDGGAHTKFLTNGRYGTEYLIEHVRERKVVDLEEAHWRLSGYSAYAAGLKDRGALRAGMPADIIIYDFDKLEIRPVETAYDFPANEWRRIQKADGYRYVLVNGVTTFIDGECTGATPGQLLRHGQWGEPPEAPRQRAHADNSATAHVTLEQIGPLLG
jgi:N-acyl-D-amino-acid deacylase